MFFFENCTFTCITDTWYGSYAGKIDVFLLRMSLLPGKTVKTDKKPAPRALRAVKQAQKIEEKHREGTESGQRQFPPPFFAKNELGPSRYTCSLKLLS